MQLTISNHCYMFLVLALFTFGSLDALVLRGADEYAAQASIAPLSGDSEKHATHGPLLVIFLAHPAAFSRVRWIRDMYLPYYPNIVFYSDYQFCSNRAGHHACYGKALTNGKKMGGYMGKKELEQVTHSSLDEDHRMVIDSVPVKFITLGGGWLMHRALIDAIANSPKRYSGYLFGADDAIFLPWNMRELDPKKFWLTPMWRTWNLNKENSTHSMVGPICGIPCDGSACDDEKPSARNRGFKPCELDLSLAKDLNLLHPHLLPRTASDTLSDAYKFESEYHTWHANASLRFCAGMDAATRERWSRNFERSLGLRGQDCPVLQVVQPDMFYVPGTYAEQWLRVASQMDAEGMEFHHLWATSALGLAPAEDIEVLKSQYGGSDCLKMMRMYPHWHAHHPCKWGKDEEHKLFVRRLFAEHPPTP